MARSIIIASRRDLSDFCHTKNVNYSQIKGARLDVFVVYCIRVLGGVFTSMAFLEGPGGDGAVRAGGGKRWFGLAPGRVPAGCGGRRGGSPLPGRESIRAGQGALIGRTVRRGKVPTSSPAGRAHTRVGVQSGRTYRLRAYRSPPRREDGGQPRRCAVPLWAGRGRRGYVEWNRHPSRRR